MEKQSKRVFNVGTRSFITALIILFLLMAMTYALRFAPSATLAPLHYLEIVMATLLGWAIFGDFPGGMVWGGIAVIVGSGLYIIWRERQAPAAPRPAPPAAGSPPPGR